LIVILLVGVCVYSGYRLGEWKVNKDLRGTGIVDTSLMNEALSHLKESYLKPEDIDATKLKYGAAQGMTQALGDPYTSFFTPEENKRSNDDLAGFFGGVGIELGYIDKTLAVVAPIKDSPAAKAGITAGDLILNIKDEANNVNKDTTGISLDDAVNLIRGQKGTAVILTIYHENEIKSRDVTLIRDTINVPSTEINWIDSGKVAVVTVSKFGEQTLSEWNKIVTEIISKKASGVILDLRNNPGGYLQRAVDLGSEFIADGVIVKQREKSGTQVMNVDRKGRLVGMPLVVLINKGSASASEILAGALRERIGVKLVGENSFGKGTVQEKQDFAGGAGIHVTIAEWLLPSGKNIHGEGLVPDVLVEYVYDEKNPKEDNQLNRALEVLHQVELASKK